MTDELTDFHIAYTMAPGRGDTDLLLFRLASALRRNGWRACGVVQTNTDREIEGPCDMDVKVLPDGPVLRISQSLGRAATGCRLDPSALEAAVGHVEATFKDGADCLIVNKFGKHEAEGRGFRAVIAEALAQGIPVLIGVNALNLEAFEVFTGGIAERLPPDEAALERWLSDRLQGEAARLVLEANPMPPSSRIGSPERRNAMRTRPDVIETLQLPTGKVEVDEAGYLVDPSNWSREFAMAVAEAEGIVPSALHWRVLGFMRDYHEEHGIAADARFVLRFLATELDTDKHGAKEKLFELFPFGYVRQACKMAGMRQPRAWSTG